MWFTFSPDGLTWKKWRETGKDQHSIYADPHFVDPERYDFRLQPDSPALAMGFEPIDMTTVGPRRSRHERPDQLGARL